MQNPSRWNSGVVNRGQHIPGMEGEWVFVVDPRQSYVSTALITFMPIDSFLNLQRVQEKVFFGTCFTSPNVMGYLYF